MTDLEPLIAKLEAATEEEVCDPEWLHDVRTAIADACFGRSDRHRPSPQWWFQGFIGWQPLEDAPNWLFSIDAAKTLIPFGNEWLRKSPGTMTVYRIPESDKEWARHFDGKGWNDASSLVIACLRAIHGENSNG